MMHGAIIGHIDADCFYVSCERLRTPGLQGKPVGVLGNQGACVIAKSYELKAKGVKTGMPIWDAIKLCPEAVYVKRDFHWYEVLSRMMLELVRESSLRVEYYSVDELFFDASLLPVAFQCPFPEAARKLKEAMERAVGVPVSLGVSRSKLLAKLASDSGKPSGCRVALSHEECAALLKDRPVDEVAGIAHQNAKRLETIGVRTCDQFVAADRLRVRKILTKKGEDMWWELNGVSVLPIVAKRPMHRFVARGGSIGKASDDRLRIEGFLMRNVERMIEALEFNGYVTDRLGLMLGFEKIGRWHGSVALLGATSLFEDIAPAARALFDEAWKGRAVNYMHVIAERLQTKDRAQRGFFDRDDSRPSMTTLMRKVNAKCGRFAVRSGATLPIADIYTDEASSYDICDIHGKTCF